MKDDVCPPGEHTPHAYAAQHLFALETKKGHEADHHAYPHLHKQGYVPAGEGAHHGRGRKGEQRAGNRERRCQVDEAHEEDAVEPGKRHETQQRGGRKTQATTHRKLDAAVKGQVDGCDQLKEDQGQDRHEGDRRTSDDDDRRQVHSRVQSQHALSAVGGDHGPLRLSWPCGHAFSGASSL